MFLVIESGASKLQWVLAHKGGVLREGLLPGLHPFLSSAAHWQQTLAQLCTDLALQSNVSTYYYGTGCAQQAGVDTVSAYFEQHAPLLYPLVVETDLLAAARALCQDQPGIACILGTGSNAGGYDGRQIVHQRGGLGFILGDEGSGAALGLLLLRAWLYGQLSPSLTAWLADHHRLSREHIITHIYKGDNPSQYLASFAPVVHEWMEKDTGLYHQVVDHYQLLVQNTLLPLHRLMGTHVVHFTGSVAVHFHPVINQVLRQHGLTPGIVEGSPMALLLDFHRNNI
ncbi:MAG: hypothetical protein R2795_00885 [Saprospiraceae bacterium]